MDLPNFDTPVNIHLQWACADFDLMTLLVMKELRVSNQILFLHDSHMRLSKGFWGKRKHVHLFSGNKGILAHILREQN